MTRCILTLCGVLVFSTTCFMLVACESMDRQDSAIAAFQTEVAGAKALTADGIASPLKTSKWIAIIDGVRRSGEEVVNRYPVEKRNRIVELLQRLAVNEQVLQRAAETSRPINAGGATNNDTAYTAADGVRDVMNELDSVVNR